MTSRLLFALPLLLLAACATSESGVGSRSEGRCLYAIERGFGRDTRWASCTAPPACAVERLTGDDRSRIGAGC